MKQFVPLLLFVVVFFANTQAQITYYVSAINGSDSNDGTSTSTPFEDIKTAVSAATTGDQILITAETYTINGVITVNEDITITGGYNATFSEQTGYTTLDGNEAKRIIDFIGVADSVLPIRLPSTILLFKTDTAITVAECIWKNQTCR